MQEEASQVAAVACWSSVPDVDGIARLEHEARTNTGTKRPALLGELLGHVFLHLFRSLMWLD